MATHPASLVDEARLPSLGSGSSYGLAELELPRYRLDRVAQVMLGAVGGKLEYGQHEFLEVREGHRLGLSIRCVN